MPIPCLCVYVYCPLKAQAQSRPPCFCQVILFYTLFLFLLNRINELLVAYFEMSSIISSFMHIFLVRLESHWARLYFSPNSLKWALLRSLPSIGFLYPTQHHHFPCWLLLLPPHLNLFIIGQNAPSLLRGNSNNICSSSLGTVLVLHLHSLLGFSDECHEGCIFTTHNWQGLPGVKGLLMTTQLPLHKLPGLECRPAVRCQILLWRWKSVRQIETFADARLTTKLNFQLLLKNWHFPPLLCFVEYLEQPWHIIVEDKYDYILPLCQLCKKKINLPLAQHSSWEIDSTKSPFFPVAVLSVPCPFHLQS